MQKFYRHILILIVLISCSNRLFGQDTIVYRGFVSKILYESIQLYPDKTFKWTSEYDLSWSEYGIYEIEKNNLRLKYFLLFKDPVTISIKDSIKYIPNPVKVENFKMVNEYLYKLDCSGKEIHRMREKSIRTFGSWIFGHKYEIKR